MAPDITINLPTSEGRTVARKESVARDTDASRMRGSRRAGSGASSRELADGQHEKHRLQRQLDRVEAENARAAARIDELLGNLTQAMSEQDQAVAERDTALAVRDHALAERDQAVTARDEAIYERDALSRANERLQSQLANFVSARGASLVMRRAAQEDPASGSYAGLLPGAIAIIALLAIVVVMIVLRAA